MDEKDKKWLCPEQAKREQRLAYIQQMQSFTPNTCPECGDELTHTENEIYCNHCGLIVMTSIAYVAGLKIHLPYGLLLI